MRTILTIKSIELVTLEKHICEDNVIFVHGQDTSYE